MTTLFKLAYSLVVAILLVLFVILGVRTFYDEPETPEFSFRPPPVKPIGPGSGETEEPLYCEFDGRCFKGGREITSEDEAELTDDERDYISEQRDFYDRQRKYEDDRVDYRRNVFVLASALGVAAVAAGLYLFRRLEAVPLGLLLGGFGIIIYGWAQAADEFDEIGEGPLFAVVSIGLVILLAAGYGFLGERGQPGGEG